MTRTRALPSAAGGVAIILLVLYPLALQALFTQNSARFWTLSVGSQSIILGIVALSMIFMAGYGGMISLAQAAISGLAAYFTAIAMIKLGMGWLPGAVVGVIVATLAGGLFGAISARSYGIYFLMLTLALAMGVYYLVLQNYDVFGGHIGFAGVVGPTGQPRANSISFYYMTLGFAILAYLGLRYLARSQIGLTFQGIRDNPRRMRALGYWVGIHRVAIFAIAGLVAGVGGVLNVWYSGNISPGDVDITRTIDILMIAVVGGLTFPIGAFIGAVFFVLVQTFASSIVVLGYSFEERFNTLIGLAFLVVVVFAPTGIVGLTDRMARAARRRWGSLGTQPSAPEAETEPGLGAPDPPEHQSGDSTSIAP
jgi:branched-chain amino acid transport system permease protein